MGIQRTPVVVQTPVVELPMPLLLLTKVVEVVEIKVLTVAIQAALAESFCVMPTASQQLHQQLAVSQLQFQVDIGITILQVLGALLSNGTFCAN
jgi:hypothetical protein